MEDKDEEDDDHDPEAPNVVAALDTNVILAIWSCHDVTSAYDNVYSTRSERAALSTGLFVEQCDENGES